MFWEIYSIVGMQTGSGTPLYLMMHKRQETEVTKLSQRNLFFCTVYTITSRADKYRVICPSSINATGTSSRSKHPISENIMLQQPVVLAQVSPSS